MERFVSFRQLTPGQEFKHQGRVLMKSFVNKAITVDSDGPEQEMIVLGHEYVELVEEKAPVKPALIPAKQ
jgi:hypothetical protein